MKVKRITITCRCNAYPFPHRFRGGKCKAVKPVQFNDDLGSLDERECRIIVRSGPEFEYDDELDRE